MNTVKCPECGSAKVARDEEKGEIICNNCGLVLSEDEVDLQIGVISEFARHYGVQIVSADPRPLPDFVDANLRSNYAAYEIRFELEADYHAFGKLLADLYRMPKQLRIQKISLIGRQKSSELNRISLTLLLVSTKKEGKSA